MLIRRATPEELGLVDSLLETVGRPPLPAALSLSNVFVALDDDAIVGVVALHVTGRRGLVLPVATRPEHSGDGVAPTLFQTLLARAHELGLRELYLQSEEDLDFYEGLGFTPIPREEIPTEVASTRAYRSQRSAPATPMRLRLETRFV